MTGVFLWVMCSFFFFFFLAAFKTCSCFQKCHYEEPWVYPVWGLHSFLDLCVYLAKFWEFSVKNFFNTLLTPLTPSVTLMAQMLSLLVPQVTKVLFIIFLVYLPSFVHIAWNLLFCPQVHQLYPVISSLLLSPLRNFFIGYCIF